jgi:hypothetical protein
MITGQDVIDALWTLKRKGADSEKLAEFYILVKQAGVFKDNEYTKIQEIITGTFKDERNLADDVREWVETANGVFLSSDVVKCLQVSSRNDQKNVSKILTRLSTEAAPLIEKHGNKNGCYRRLVSTEYRMNLKGVDLTPINISLPLNMQKKTILFKKAIVCVAGVTGTGKTSFALNFIRDNMHDNKVYYLSNGEMHEQALQFKCTHFQNMSIDDWKFTPLGVTDDFSSSIRPDDINIIDYLEAPNSEFWKIGESIRAIERKLKNGMALILLQRKSKALWGEGAEFGARASSLYINMAWGSIEIMKNRYREGDQFVGMDKRDFDIKYGLMVSRSGWYGSGTADKPQANPVGRNDFVHEGGE